MGAVAFGLALIALCMFEYDLLTSPDRTGSESLILWTLPMIALILSVAAASAWSGPYRRNKDDSPDDP